MSGLQNAAIDTYLPCAYTMRACRRSRARVLVRVAACVRGRDYVSEMN